MSFTGPMPGMPGDGPQVTGKPPSPAEHKAILLEGRRAELKKQQGIENPFLKLPETAAAIKRLPARVAEAINMRGSVRALGNLLDIAGNGSVSNPLPKIASVITSLCPSLRTIMAEGGAVAGDARQLYMAIWTDLENGITGLAMMPQSQIAGTAHPQEIAAYWMPFLADAKQQEGQALLASIIRQPPARGTKPGAFAILQRCMQNRKVLEMLLGPADVSEILTLLAHPAWESSQAPAQRQAKPGIPMPLSRPLPLASRSSMPAPPRGGLPFKEPVNPVTAAVLGMNR